MPQVVSGPYKIGGHGQSSWLAAEVMFVSGFMTRRSIAWGKDDAQGFKSTKIFHKGITHRPALKICCVFNKSIHRGGLSNQVESATG